SPDPSPNGDAVVFYSRYNPEGHLYVVRGDGSGLRQLTGDSYIDRMPRWSPDGRSIVFFSNRSGEYQLWQIRPDGSDLRQITQGGGGFVVWSPDGSKIVTSRNNGYRNEPAGSYIFDAAAPGPARPTLLPPLQPASDLFIANSWSPDARRIAGQVGFDGRGIVVYSIGDGAYDRLLNYG